MHRRQAIQLATVVLGGIVSPGLLKAAISDELITAKKNSSALFGSPEKQILNVLTELIIPTTTTPGAIAAGVPDFVEAMVRDWYTKKEKGIFLSGLAGIDKYSHEHYQVPFIDASAEQQTATLSYFESLSKDYKPANTSILSAAQTDENTPFFTKIKELTVLGYFSSELGVKQSLAYDPMPMEYKADISLAELGGKQWAQY